MINLHGLGLAYKCLRHANDMTSSLASMNDATSAGERQWQPLANRQLPHVTDQLLVHVTRTLNICAHVLDDEAPVAPPSSRTTLPSLPNAPVLSPIKRKSKAAKDDAAAAGGNATPQGDKSAGKGVNSIQYVTAIKY